ncbi:hypothetical protein thsrh120_32530 [Rhizobium sp. No.120]
MRQSRAALRFLEGVEPGSHVFVGQYGAHGFIRRPIFALPDFGKKCMSKVGYMQFQALVGFEIVGQYNAWLFAWRSDAGRALDRP